MFELTNRDRAERAAAALDEYGNDDPGADLRDLLTDLIHFAHRTSVDFERGLQMARVHFEEEQLDEQSQKDEQT